LIAESGAKGKGFWRRRRRKAEAPAAGTPVAAESGTASSGEVPVAPSVESKGDSPDDGKGETATVAEVDGAEKPVEADAETEADGNKIAESGAAEDAEPADPEPAGAEGVEDEDDPTSKVGVVYEPDDSPEGFPLEYGEIIIGLPKQPESGKKPAAPAAEEAADGSAESEAPEVDDEETPQASAETPSEDDAEPAADEAAPADEEAATSSEEAHPEAPAEPDAGAAGEPDDADADAESASEPDDAAGSGDAEPAAESEGAAETASESDDAAEPAVEADEPAAEADDPAEPGAEADDPAEADDAAGTAAGSGDGTETGDAAETGADEGAESEAEQAPEDGDAAGAADETDQPVAEEVGDADAEQAAEAEPEQTPDAELPAEQDAEAEAEDVPPVEAEERSEVEAVEGPEDAEASEADTDDVPESATESAEASDPADEGTANDESPANDESAASGEGDQGAGDADDAIGDERAEDAGSTDDSAGADGSAKDESAAGGESDEGAGDADDVVGDERGEDADGTDDSAGSDGAEGSANDESAAGSEGAASDEVAGDEGEQGVGDADDDGEGVVAEELSAEEAAARGAAEQAAMALITALMRLRGALASSQLPIDVVGADEARQEQKSMLDQLDDYVLPRLVQLEAPVLAVVGGSTGAGKSTLVNSLIGQVVSEPGVLRPTTRSPVLIHHPADAEWFAGDRVLPGMARSSGDSPGGIEGPGQIRLVAADTVPQGLTILDAPDIDSVVEANRELATQLLAAADLWLFVTTAARYADAVPWDFLQSASDRSTAVAVVLDRAPADTIDDITGHLAQMLLERGLGDSPLFSIKETVVDGNGMLPTEVVASIKDWLIDLAADAEARSAVVRRTLHGAVTAMTKKTPAFAKAVRAQADTLVELRSTAESAYDRAVKDVAKATQDGTMLRGEVLARWQEFVGTGELLKGLQTNVGRARDKVRAAVVGKPPPTRDLKDAVESGLESLLREHAEAAAERAEESWQSTAPGRQLLATGDRDMGRMSKEFPAEASRAVREWQGFVLELVRKEGADKRSTARILAYGVNGLGLALMIVIFASTAGLTGAEVGVGAGTAVVGQKLLEAVFGDQAVRTLATKARENLDGRVHALMDAEFARYLAVLDQHPVDSDAPRRLTEAARAVEDCT